MEPNNTISSSNNNPPAPPPHVPPPPQETAQNNPIQAARERRRRLLQVRKKPGYDHGARHYSTLVWRLIIPVSICILAVVWSVKNISPLLIGGTTSSPIPMVSNENLKDTSVGKATSGLLNALVAVGFIAAMTFLLVLLYKFRFMRCLGGWLICSVMISLSFQCLMWIDLFCVHFQIPYDMLTIGIVLWNFSVVGTMAIFFYAHPYWRQLYLIAVSILIAWLLSLTPKWTTWFLLAAVSIYDIVAVLCPQGPLALLLKEAEKHEEPIPGLVYVSQSSQMTVQHAPKPPSPREQTQSTVPILSGSMKNNSAATTTTTTSAVIAPPPPHTTSTNNETSIIPTTTTTIAPPPPPPPPTTTAPQYEYESDSFMLGLGDFIFYSILVGRASVDSFFTWVVCFMAIICGFCVTLLCLAVTQRALPALPFSIFFGIIFYVLAQFVMSPYAVELTLSGIYV